MAEIKKWGGWKQIDPSEKDKVIPLIQEEKKVAPEPPAPEPVKIATYETPLSPEKLDKIDTSLPQKIANEKYARRVSRIDEIKKPDVCSLCGSDISSEYFILYHPTKIKICRGCRQSNKRCPHCLDLHGFKIGDHIPMCDDCMNKKRCTCCQKTFDASALVRIDRKKGVYCSGCLSGRHCAFCDLPTARTLDGLNVPICQFCSSTALKELDALWETEDMVRNLFVSLAPKMIFPSYELRFFDPEEYQGTPFSLQSPSLLFVMGVPERYLSAKITDTYASELLKKIPKAQKSPSLLQALKSYFRLLMWAKTGDYLAFENEKAIGLKSLKEFRPLFQAYDKLGSEGSWKYLVKLITEGQK